MRRYLGYKVLAVSFNKEHGGFPFRVMSPCFILWNDHPIWMRGGDSYIGVFDVRADCKKMVLHQSIPDERCTCGLYISTNWDKFLEWTKHNAFTRVVLNDQFLLFTIVEASGTLIEHDDGFRAERARVRKIIHVEKIYQDQSSYQLDKRVIFQDLEYISERSGLPIIQDYEARDLIEGKAYPLFSIPPYQKGDER